jgi:nucleotide-binding universal stress UspA family protein
VTLRTETHVALVDIQDRGDSMSRSTASPVKTQCTPSVIALENLLFATDFHSHSNAALPYALSIARRHGSKVYVAHVIALSPFSAPSPTSALRAIEAQALREANDAAAGLKPLLGDIPSEFLIRKGNVWKEISDIVDKKQIKLIVVGTHGRQGAAKVVMGSVAEQIFRHARCPVLTIGPKIHGDPDTFAGLHSILVPTDFSPESHGAISWAASLAQLYQSRLYLFHATSAEETQPACLKSAIRNLLPAEMELSFAPKVFVESGTPSQKILDLADELAVDLIVLGVKPPSLLKGTSTHQNMATACKVVSGAGCPVITVRA